MWCLESLGSGYLARGGARATALFLLAMGATLGVSCGKDSRSPKPKPNDVDPAVTRNAIDPDPQQAALPNIADSFFVVTSDSKDVSAPASGEPRVAIRKDALGKEFLLQASLITQVPYRSWSGLRSRVVMFKVAGGKLNLLESTKGLIQTEEDPRDVLLAQFPITSTQDGMISFDFAQGMSRIFAQGDWAASDIEGFVPPSWQVVPVALSYLESASFEQNTLHIDQLVQTEQEGFLVFPGQVSTVLMRYWLSPYRPDPSYRPSPRADFKRFGFFEVAPQVPVSSGQPIVRATRFHPEKPIVFSVSANTPPEFRQAVMDGVLYWNQAFGREAVQVNMAPEGVFAPDFERNMVQWVRFDDAGFAYADAQMDPRSGEILRAHVFMASAFAVGGRQQAQSFLRLMETKKDKDVLQEQISKVLGMKGFSAARLCQYDGSERLAQGLRALLQAGASDAVILKASQDYVREVVAHEIGHTLGLRHNFAGSLGSNVALSQRDDLTKKYFAMGGRTPEGVVPTSSVMEYNAFAESVMAGDLIARRAGAFRYDIDAIAKLYAEQDKKSEAALFCTDSHMGAYADCAVFDVGSSPVELAAEGSRTDAVESVAFAAASALVQWLAPPEGYETPSIDEFDLEAGFWAPVLVSGQWSLRRALAQDLRLLRVERRYAAITSANRDQVRKDTEAFVDAELARFQLDALPQPVDLPAKGVGERVASRAVALVSSPAFREFTNWKGESLRLTDDEIAKAAEIFREFGKALEVQVFRSSLELSRGGMTSPLRDLDLARRLIAQEDDFARSVLFESNGEISLEWAQPTGEARQVRLPTYVYPLEQRVKAAEVLAASRTGRREEGIVRSAQALDQLDGIAEAQLGSSLYGVELEVLPEAAMAWVLDNRSVASVLSSGASGTSF
jgi:hypothetical protein